jgi:hypothetical protein
MGMINTDPVSTIAIENIERDAWLDLFAAQVDRSAAAEVGFQLFRGCGLVGCKEVPITELNRAMGVGVPDDTGGAMDDKDRNLMADWLGEHCAPHWAIQVPPLFVTKPFETWVKSRGLRPAGHGWAKLHRDALQPAPELEMGEFLTRPAAFEEADEFAATVHAGFGTPPAFADWPKAIVGRAGWHCYLAFDRSQPIAAGAMYIQHALAWIGMTATLSSHRNRGAQSVLIRRAIVDGLARGVTIFTAETYPPVGDQRARFTSFRNFQRAGFDLAYLRANYSPGS